MSKKNPLAKWVLPSVVNPPDRRCITIFVPDEPYHIAAFRGALLNLQSAYKWADDPAHTAREVALVWRDIIDAMDWGCDVQPFDVRQNAESPCKLEKTEDDGTTWVEFADLQKCPPRVRINGGIVQWYNPATGEWEEVDGGDERSDGDAPVPYPSNPDGACLAAENITAVYQTTLTQIRAGVAAGQAATLLATTITGIGSVFISPMIYATVSLAIASAALSLTTVGLDIMLDSEHLENFKCQVYINAESDGSITAAGFTAIREGMASWASGLELSLIQYYLDGYGSVGLQRQATAGGITTGDCEACYDIYISYLNGSGDTAVVSGGTIECAVSLTSSPFYTLSFETNVCVEIELVALSGWTSPVGVDGNMWAGYVKECGDTSFHAGYTDPFTYVWDNEAGFDISSLSAGCTATLRLTVV